LIRQGETVRQSVLSAAGKFCNYISEGSITYDHDEAIVMEQEAVAKDITHLPAEPAALESIQQLEQKTNDILQGEIIYADEPLTGDWFQSTPIIEALAEELRQNVRADGAMSNARILVHGFQARAMTYKGVHQAWPHPITPVLVSLNGDGLLEVIRASLPAAFLELELKGVGH